MKRLQQVKNITVEQEQDWGQIHFRIRNLTRGINWFLCPTEGAPRGLKPNCLAEGRTEDWAIVIINARAHTIAVAYRDSYHVCDLLVRRCLTCCRNARQKIMQLALNLAHGIRHGIKNFIEIKNQNFR